MSITVHHHLQQALDGRSLIEAEPEDRRTVVRRIVMGESVARLLSGEPPEPEWTQSAWDFRLGQIQKDFDAFLNGDRVTMTLDPHSDAEDCFLKRIDPISDQVFEIRLRKPPPGIRVFGMFAERDIFVAFHWRWRKDMGSWGSSEWDTEIWNCKAEWNAFFKDIKPKSGNKVDDYVKNALPV